MKYIIAPRKYHLLLLNYLRKEDPFLDIKIYSKESLARSLFISAKEEAIVYLMKTYGYSYEISKMYLSDIQYVSESNNTKINFLNKIKQELIEHDLVLLPSEERISNIEATIYGYSEHDFELKNLLETLKINPNYINYINKDIKRNLCNFEKIEEEVYYVLNEIASLIASGVLINNIYIFRRNKEYDYYLKKFSPLFGYQLNLDSGNSYASTGATKEFFKIYDEQEDLNASLEILKEEMQDDPLYLGIEDLVLSNQLDTTFEIQKDYLVNKFKEKTIEEVRYDKAVNVISSPLYLENKHVFVMGFTQGLFPQSYKDDKYLNNEELHLINRLNSKDKTKCDELELISFFNSSNDFYYSFANKSVSSKYYASPLAKIFDMDIHTPELADTFYSLDVLKLIYADLKDLDNFYKEQPNNFYKIRDVIDIDYNSYKNDYLYKVNAYNKDSKIKLSTTSLDVFSHCPFRYYLDRVLKVDEFEYEYAASLGNIAHHIFEKMREKDFDFDKEFMGKIDELSLKSSEKFILTHNVKEQILVAMDAIKKREHYYKNPAIYNEVELVHNIDDKTYIDGKIDNLVILDNKYYVIIDYKTGSTKFDDSKIKDGLSTQLPTYALLASGNKRFEHLTLAGLYINNVLTSSLHIEQKEDELIPSYLKLNGKTLGDVDAVSYIDSTIADLKSSFINNVALKKDGCSLKETNAIVSENGFKDYMNTVSELYVEMNKKLRNNEFNISPYFKNDRDNGCQYCPYKDICYVRSSQYRVLSKEENEDE